jgi:hypothetical protein
VGILIFNANGLTIKSHTGSTSVLLIRVPQLFAFFLNAPRHEVSFMVLLNRISVCRAMPRPELVAKSLENQIRKFEKRMKLKYSSLDFPVPSVD